VSAQYKHIQLRRGTQSSFDTANPVLKSGEPAFSTDARVLKIGDGTSTWKDLNSVFSARTATVTVNIPAINVGDTHNIAVTMPNISSSHSHFVSVSPDEVLPNDLAIDYAYVSANDTITIRVVNRIHTNLSGNAGAVASSPLTDVKLNVFTCVTEAITLTTTTTTTIPPVADDIYSWGSNEFGQLGLNHKDNKLVPTFVVDNEVWADFDLGHYHSLGLDSSGDIHSCGYNYYGQLGQADNGQGTNRKVFTPVISGCFQDDTVYGSGVDFECSKVSAGSQHSLAVTKEGILFSAGGGNHGALGNNLSNKDKFTIVGIDNYTHVLSDGDVISNAIANGAFALGGNHDQSRTKYAAGIGTYRLDNIPAASAIAVIDADGSNIAYTGQTLTSTVGTTKYYSGYVDITVAGDYDTASVSTLNDGFIDNGQNLLYYDNPNGIWSEVSAGNYHSLGIKNSCLYTWGNNAFGQLGDGDTRDRHTPTKIGTKNNWTKVAAGNNHSLALDSNGVVYAFGSNANGQLGLGDNNNRHTPTQIVFDFSNFTDANFTVLPSGNIVSIESYNGSNRYSLDASYDPLERFVLSAGSVYTLSGVPQAHPVAVLNRGNTSKISYTGQTKSGSYTVMGTTADGTYDFYYGDVYITVNGDFDKASIYCANHGYMGGRNLLYYDQPSYNITDIKAGVNHSVLLTDADNVLTFGQNHRGQLGTGDNADRTTPYRLPDPNISTISAGGHHTFLTNSQRYILGFGDNSDGQLGLGDIVSRNEADTIETQVRWQRAFAGGSHSIATVYSYYPSQITNLTLEDANGSDKVGHRQLYASWDHSTALEQGITDYAIQYSIDGGVNWVTYEDGVSTNTNVILDGLDDGGNYVVRVAPINNIGSGTYVSQSSSKNPAEASDPDFAKTIVYTHLDSGVAGMDDLSNTSATVSSGIVNSNAGHTLDGKFSESVRLTEEDFIKYTFTAVPNVSGVTAECFWKPNGTQSISVGNQQPILRITDGTEDYLTLSYDGSASQGYRFLVHDSGNAQIISTTSQSVSDFTHLAVVRDSGLAPTTNAFHKVSLFVDGKQLDTARSEGDYTITDFILSDGTGANQSGKNSDFNIDEARLSTITRYSGVFDPTTKPFGLA
jgi:alpha-tubulin suppressor-like RCC1 family protein